MSGLKKIENPHEAVVAVGKQNSELVEEVTFLHMEIDHYRRVIESIMYMPLADIAADPNKPRLVATIGLSKGTVTEVPDAPHSSKRIIVS